MTDSIEESISEPNAKVPSLNKGFDCCHCGQKTNNPLFLTDNFDKKPFCCSGCMTVYEIINDHKLEEYYKLKDLGSQNEAIPVIEQKANYAHYDEQNFQSEYLQKYDDYKKIKIYLEGVHCMACLWLIENTPRMSEEIISANLNYENSLAEFTLTPVARLSSLGQLLGSLGYTPHPIKNDDELQNLKVKEERDYLIRLGVAMACMGNILLFSISIYAGLEGKLKDSFEWLSFFISLPVFLYSATPFYKSALSSLKQKRFNIDLPVSLALILGGLGGLYTLISGHGEAYFDSLTSLVFLLLLSRYVLLKIKQNGVSNSSLEYLSSFGSVKVIDNEGKQKTILAKYLKEEDIVCLESGDLIPADGVVLEGTCAINTSLLTGESNPIKANEGSSVFSGTQVLSGSIKIKVLHTGEATKLGFILSEVNKEKSKLSPIATLSDTISRYFIGVVLLLSIGLVSYFALQGNTSEGAMRALTLLIITCPCALALATPLALASAIHKLSSLGIIVKSEDVIEKIVKSKDIYLDKTGTLTKGIFQVSSWSSISNNNYYDIVWSLEHKAQHPMAQSLKNYIKSMTEPMELPYSDWIETPGVGVSAKIDNKIYKIGKFSSSDPLSTTIALYENEIAVLKIQLKDNLRFDSIQSIENIKKSGFKPYLVSGDSEKNVKNIAKILGIPPEHTFARVTPKDKVEIVKNSPLSIMVGDGANDAMALKEAEVGIAVKGSLDISLKAADIYLSKMGVSPINEVINISRECIYVIKRNMLFSILYNLVGATLAINGYLNPLWAAVLMPLSSFTVLLSTYFWIRRRS
ncbi:MAG: hypothetical protein CME70_14760 [Halobacteriovorax sp.]|nr:hypothetical protein [Halobacteriovorax sp.]|tara:strand:- start:178637 stop:181054 length:2418 start_codon:yes stop_codon:yes gene_type:complete